MKLWFRILYVWLTWRSRPRLTIDEVSRVNLRVWPTDLDVYNHMNNGVFLTLMDIGRYDQGLRTGIWQEWNRRGWVPHVGYPTITYRQALLPWEQVTIRTQGLRWDEISY